MEQHNDQLYMELSNAKNVRVFFFPFYYTNYYIFINKIDIVTFTLQ